MARRCTVADLAPSDPELAQPGGYISYQPDGRVFVILVESNRAKPAGSSPTDEEKIRLFGTLIAYSGLYVVEGDKITHKIDVSWSVLE